LQGTSFWAEGTVFHTGPEIQQALVIQRFIFTLEKLHLLL